MLAARLMKKVMRKKVMPDGRAMLNLGCGWKMHRSWNNLDFSPYAKLRRQPWLVKVLERCGCLSETRRRRLAQVDPEIIHWDLRRGIPFDTGTFDAVYHSHFLEHIDREAAPVFLRECHRVLKEGGVIRVVVPDWQRLVSDYLKAVEAWEKGVEGAEERHRRAMHELIDQMVRVGASGVSEQRTWVSRLEGYLRGGAAATGELHRWMYDRYSLGALLESIGFREVRPETATSSRISGWAEFGLDTDDQGNDYKWESLYMEGVK